MIADLLRKYAEKLRKEAEGKGWTPSVLSPGVDNPVVTTAPKPSKPKFPAPGKSVDSKGGAISTPKL